VGGEGEENGEIGRDAKGKQHIRDFQRQTAAHQRGVNVCSTRGIIQIAALGIGFPLSHRLQDPSASLVASMLLQLPRQARRDTEARA